METLLEKGKLRAQGQQEDNLLIFQHFHRIQHELSQKERELQQAEEYIKQLETDLDSCHAQIFRSIPTYEVSDATISEEFTRICENLTNWVEVLPEFTISRDTFQDVLKEFELHYLVDEFLIESQDLILAQSEIISRVIFQHLFNELFRVWLPGASPLV